MSKGQRVLVIDGQSETEEVLKAVLEPQGLQVNRIRETESAGRIQDDESPNVVVMDADASHGNHDRFQHFGEVPRVVIGSAQFRSLPDQPAGDHYLQKPFQYRELIQAIEGLLAQSGQAPSKP